jgi:predicted nucleic acid-binding protein
MSLIVDASVAVKWVVEEPGSDAAAAVLSSGERLIAPDLVLAEIGNAVRKKLSHGIIPREQAVLAARTAERAFDELVPIRLLAASAIELALGLNRPVYDCFYVVLAARERMPLITADDRLRAAAERANVEARPLL